MSSGNFSKRIRLCALAALLVAAAGGGASAYTLKTLYTFCVKAQCADGEVARGGVTQDGLGNLFGTTFLGGNKNDGTIFELTRSKQGKYKFHTLYNFCARTACADGKQPIARLVVDTAGNLYGTTTGGGKTNWGVAFEFTPKSKHSGTLKVLHSFCLKTNCSDGGGVTAFVYAGAASGALYDGVSPLYGSGGSGVVGQYGLIYELDPGTTWKYTVIHSFCAISGCPDGAFPGVLSEDGSGNLFGEAIPLAVSGVNQGTVFELSPTGQGKWTETTLYAFCPQTPCSGAIPGLGPLVIDGSGNLLDGGGGGTGAHCNYTDGCGTLFKVVPNGTHSTEQVLYNFCSLPDCADGSSGASLTMDTSSNLLGTTVQGGGHDGDFHGLGGGTIFKWSGGAVQVLYAFCAQTNCADGAYPTRNLQIDSSGAIFGTTLSGGIGVNGDGTVFELTP